MAVVYGYENLICDKAARRGWGQIEYASSSRRIAAGLLDNTFVYIGIFFIAIWFVSINPDADCSGAESFIVISMLVFPPGFIVDMLRRLPTDNLMAVAYLQLFMISCLFEVVYY